MNRWHSEEHCSPSTALPAVKPQRLIYQCKAEVQVEPPELKTKQLQTTGKVRLKEPPELVACHMDTEPAISVPLLAADTMAVSGTGRRQQAPLVIPTKDQQHELTDPEQRPMTARKILGRREEL